MDNNGNKTNTQTNTSTAPSTVTTSGTNNTVFSPIPLKSVTESDHRGCVVLFIFCEELYNSLMPL